MLFNTRRSYETIFKRFEDRIAALEAEVARLRLAGPAVTPQQVDAALRDLGQKMKDGRDVPVPLNRGCVGEHQGPGERTRAAPLQRKTAESQRCASGAVQNEIEALHSGRH